MDFESDDDKYAAEIDVKEQVNALASSNHASKIFATLLVNGGEKKFQLDSGSTVNLMSDKTGERLWNTLPKRLGKNICDSGNVQPV